MATLGVENLGAVEISPDWMKDAFCRSLNCTPDRGKISKLWNHMFRMQMQLQRVDLRLREWLLLHGITPINSLLQTITETTLHPVLANSQLLAPAKMHCRCILHSHGVHVNPDTAPLMVYNLQPVAAVSRDALYGSRKTSPCACTQSGA